MAVREQTDCQPSFSNATPFLLNDVKENEAIL